MSGSFLKNSAVHQLLRRHTITGISPDPATRMMSGIKRYQMSHSRSYFRISQFFKKSGEAKEVFPYIFTSRSFSASASPPRSLASSFVGWYLGMIKARPIITKSVTCSIIYSAADFTSQKLASSGSEPYDMMRTLRMGAYGVLILGGSHHFWFKFLSKQFPKTDFISTFKKIVMDLVVFAPIITSVFFSFNARLQGETNEEIIGRLKRDLLPTMEKCMIYWPFCNIIIFGYVPVHLQPLVTNCFSYLWTIYVTYMASKVKVVEIN
ncbi:Peroxisomal membrane 22 kDa (Mpv17/PMP22) family protein [Euphorbia peplus]|nr:Peroxisomal membrane 22 kDa (Mpv17/PMP22) family protein [Euphorbia peplus]